MKLRSGSRCRVSGVGTQIRIASTSTEPGEIGGRVEAAAVLATPPAGAVDMADIGAAGVQCLDLG